MEKTKIAQKKDRSQEAVNVKTPARVQQARKSGPHGKQTDWQGVNNAEPKKHSATKDLTV